MRRYEPMIPRFVLGLAALGMTAVALSVLVVLPAEPDLYYDSETALSSFTTGSPITVAERATAADASSLAKPKPTVHCTDGKADREDG
jgi:hypothetical protein